MFFNICDTFTNIDRSADFTSSLVCKMCLPMCHSTYLGDEDTLTLELLGDDFGIDDTFAELSTISLVPLQAPSRWFMLRSSIIGAPSFRVSLCGGKPGGHMLFKYSIGTSAFSPSTIASALSMGSDGSPGKRAKMVSLSMSTSTLSGVRIARLHRYCASPE